MDTEKVNRSHQTIAIAGMISIGMGITVTAINAYDHPIQEAVIAGIKQALGSIVINGLGVGPVYEYFSRKKDTMKNDILCIAIPAAIGITTTFLIHKCIKESPEPFLSTLPTILLAPPSAAAFHIFRRSQEVGDIFKKAVKSVQL